MNLQPRNFTCGYSDCGRAVSSENGWFHLVPNAAPDGIIHTCPVCRRVANGTQVPGVSLGSSVTNLPPAIEALD
jgi:hypothetical protein